MNLLGHFFEWIMEVLRAILGLVSDPVFQGVSGAVAILVVMFGLVKSLKSRLSTPHPVAGARPLFGRIHRRRLRKNAQLERQTIIRDFLDATRNGDALSASLLGLPVKTRSFSALPRPRRGGAEVYAYSGEGLSTALATLALEEANRRFVVFADWDRMRLEADGTNCERILKLVARRPLRHAFRRPLLVLDNWPASGIADERAKEFRQLLSSQSVSYVLGVRKYRSDPLFENHSSTMRDAVELRKPSKNECMALIKHWLTLSEELHKGAVPETFDAADLDATFRKRHRSNIRTMLGLLGEEVGFPGSVTPARPPLIQTMPRNKELLLLCKLLALSQSVEVLARHSAIEAMFRTHLSILEEWVKKGWVRRDTLFGRRRPSNNVHGYHLANPYEGVVILRELGGISVESLQSILSDSLVLQVANNTEDISARGYWWTLFNFLVRAEEWPFEGLDLSSALSRVYQRHREYLLPDREDLLRVRASAALTLNRLGHKSDARKVLLELLNEQPVPRNDEEYIGLWRVAIDARRYMIDEVKDAEVYARFITFLVQEDRDLPVRTLLGGLKDIFWFMEKWEDAPEEWCQQVLSAAESMLTRISDGGANNMLMRLLSGHWGQYVNRSGATRPNLSDMEERIPETVISTSPRLPPGKQDRIDHYVLSRAYRLAYETKSKPYFLDKAVVHARLSLYDLDSSKLKVFRTNKQLLDHFLSNSMHAGWIAWKFQKNRELARSYYSGVLNVICAIGVDELERKQFDVDKHLWNTSNFFVSGKGDKATGREILEKLAARPHSQYYRQAQNRLRKMNLGHEGDG